MFSADFVIVTNKFSTILSQIRLIKILISFVRGEINDCHRSDLKFIHIYVRRKLRRNRDTVVDIAHRLINCTKI